MSVLEQHVQKNKKPVTVTSPSACKVEKLSFYKAESLYFVEVRHVKVKH